MKRVYNKTQNNEKTINVLIIILIDPFLMIKWIQKEYKIVF